MQPVELIGEGVWLAMPTMDDAPAITACCREPGLAEMTSSIPIPFAEFHGQYFINNIVAPEWAEGVALHWAVRVPDEDFDIGGTAGELSPQGARNLRRGSVRVPEGGHVVGMVGLAGEGTYTRRNGEGFAFDRAELGYWLSHRARSRGVMTKAARLVCAFAFDELGVQEIGWRALAGNAPSARLGRRLGFRFVGDGFDDDWRGRREALWVARLVPPDLRRSDQEPLPEGWPPELDG